MMEFNVNKFSPMMKHYISVKEKHEDCIVFYRLGDFYEMFFDDAVKASEILELTLTGRDCGSGQRAPMCGIPFHAADGYIQKLVSFGEKVAICEQLTAASDGPVERGVVKIITAGTITSSELIDDKTNNFLACVFIKDKSVAISWADITTGEFFAEKFVSEDALSMLSDKLVAINPSEIISNSYAKNLFDSSPLITHGVLVKFNEFLDSAFNLGHAEETLKKQFKIKDLSLYNLEKNDVAIAPAGALISYLEETQKQTLKIINGLTVVNFDSFMMLDGNAVRNLELTKTIRDGKRYGSLLWVLDKTKTSMGARKLQTWILNPLQSKKEIDYRLEAVEGFYKSTLVRESLTEYLSSVKDVGRLTGKISNGNLTPKDCLSLKDSLAVIPTIKFTILGVDSEFAKVCGRDLVDFSFIVDMLSKAIKEDLPLTLKEGDFIKDGYSAELDELRAICKNSGEILKNIENKEKERTGIKNLKVGFNRNYGYYIELTNSVKHLAPYDYRRVQTLLGAERFVTEELSELQSKILTAKDNALKLENSIFNDIKSVLTENIDALKLAAEVIAELDVVLSLSKVARENGYVKPLIKNFGESIVIEDGRHPVVEKASKNSFVPNDAILNNSDVKTIILTGPNMAGKSTYMRQIALITLMAHLGSFVPAKRAEIPLTDKIFTRIGASDNLVSDQSTFMVEMSEAAKILHNATKNSLVILDEIGRGTSTFDGLSIAWAIVEYITEKIGAKTLFATHYHELTELEGKLMGVKNFKIAVKEYMGSVLFLRKIMRGGTNKSFGIEVAKLAGIKTEITDRAKLILKSLEGSKIYNSGSKDEAEEPCVSEVERIIADLDVNNLSPMQALSILADLKEKISD